MNRDWPRLHPAIHLWDALAEQGLLPCDFAQKSGLSLGAVHRLLSLEYEEPINMQTAEHIARGLGSTPEFWIRLTVLYLEERLQAGLQPDLQPTHN